MNTTPKGATGGGGLPAQAAAEVQHHISVLPPLESDEHILANASNPETSGIVQAGSVKNVPETMPLALQETLENIVVKPKETETHVPKAPVERILLEMIVPLQPRAAKRVDMTALDIGGGPSAQVAAEVQHHV